MNRDRFRFRIWSEKLKRYYWSYAINVDGDLVPWTEWMGSEGEDPGSKLTIEPCIGLRDKNGKLIYDGDVVSFSWQLKDNEVCKIVWDKIHCSFACVDIKTGAHFITWYSVFENGQSNRCEIIGNIHEMDVTK